MEPVVEGLLAPHVVTDPRKAAASCFGLGEAFPRPAEMLDAEYRTVSRAYA